VGKWEDNIKIDLKEGGCEDVDWIHLGSGEDSVAGSCKHRDEHQGSINR